MTGHWHIASGQLADYLADRVDQPTASSIEAHLINCGECRQALATRFESSTVDDSWCSIERAIDDAEEAGVIEPLVALGLRIAVRSLPLSGLIELIQGGGAVLGESGEVQGLLEDVLRGVEQGQTPEGGFDLGQALEGFFGGSAGEGGGLPEGLEDLIPGGSGGIQEGLEGLFGPS